MDAPRALITTTEAARALGLSGRSLARWAQEGRLKPQLKTPGGHPRWDLDDLREQLRAFSEDQHVRGEP
jgi:excisionase family DNA binding protein